LSGIIGGCSASDLISITGSRTAILSFHGMVSELCRSECSLLRTQDRAASTIIQVLVSGSVTHTGLLCDIGY
jgi:hypothetical protein